MLRLILSPISQLFRRTSTDGTDGQQLRAREEEIQQFDIENRTSTDVTDDQQINLPKTEIQSVPEIMLRNEDFRVCYKPMELSIGPIHASNPKLLKMELKVRLVAKFIERSGRTEETLLESIQDNIQDLKKSFNEEALNEYRDDEESLGMLLVFDGCAILEFIHSFIETSLNMFGINNAQANLIRQDLFLLENQIPFQVIKLLTNSSQETETKKELSRFVHMHNVLADTEQNLSMSHVESFVDKADHLLDLLRLVLSNDQMREYSSCLSFQCVSLRKELLRNHIKHTTNSYLNIVDYSFRNVQELKVGGVTLKTSDSCNLRSISFNTHLFFRGHLKLPTLIVNESTTRKLLNLLAYEMCLPENETNSVVASYVNFLDLLIDNENDVKDLRAAGVIRNRLSSDLEVAKLFNRLGSFCLTPPRDIYKDVKSDIEKHYKREFVIWMAQLYHVHFNSPLSILAFLASITILVLSSIQAYFAIHPKK